VNVDLAYRQCERITRAEARNFSYGIRLLPPPKRRALSAVYAFARRIDDIGDGELPADRKLVLLDAARKDVREVAERPDDPVMVALADVGQRFPITLDAFEELADGCEADVRGVRYETFDDLHTYCRQVAGSVGRLSLGVFGLAPGVDRETAKPVADALGVALQLTNILRDVREDRENGRVYLPVEDLDRFGCSLEFAEGGRFADDPAALAELVRFEAARARRWYTDGLRLLPMLDRRSAACTGAMAGIYYRLLGRIEEEPLAALATRTSLPTRQKALVAARAIAGRRV
jgi:phytoene synthase